MQNFLKQVKDWAGVVALIAILVPYFGSMFAGQMFGYTTIATNALRYPNSYIDTAHGYWVDSVEVIDGDADLKIGGTSATSINRINAGTCHLWVGTSSVATIAATSTRLVDCQADNGLATGSTALNGTALTGVTLGDAVFVTAPTTTPISIGDGLKILGVAASTTQGYIVIHIANRTGGTFTFASTSANNWNYWAVDDN